MSTIKIVGWKWFIYIIPLLVWGLITPALALRAWLSVQGTRITQCLGQTFGLFAFSPTLLLAPGRAGTKRGWVALVLTSSRNKWLPPALGFQIQLLNAPRDLLCDTNEGQPCLPASWCFPVCKFPSLESLLAWFTSLTGNSTEVFLGHRATLSGKNLQPGLLQIPSAAPLMDLRGPLVYLAIFNWLPAAFLWGNYAISAGLRNV